METKNINDLKANPKNPRRLEKHDYDALVRSIKKFGDLSGIVVNVRSGQLVGGHQRTEVFKRIVGDKQIVIERRYETPNAKGTVAEGYVDFENEHYAYREVDWDAGMEASANIAANRIQGQFDLDILGQVNYEISQLENSQELLEATGQTEDEVNRLLKSVGAIDESSPVDEEPETDRLEFSLTKEQREIVEEALGNIKATRELRAVRSSSLNGTALFVICKDYLDKLHGPEDEAQPIQPATSTQS